MSRSDNNEISKMLQFVPQVGDIFDVKDKVGEGTFSKVFRAVVKHGAKKQEYALKYLVPTSKPSSIASELQCLKEIGGTNNVVGIEFCLMNKGHFVIVMPYYPHQRFSDYVRHMSIDDARDYMRNLFIALAKIHSHGIIHRDIKPNNILYNESSKKYTLVDFGLAQRVNDIESSRLLRQPLSDSARRFNCENVSKKRKLSPSNTEDLSTTANGVHTKGHSKQKETSKNSKLKECGCFKKPSVCKICLGRDPEEAPRAGTPGYRAPEVLLKHKNQTTAIDMWSAGVILLSILSKKYPFFRADDDITALAEVTFLVGTKEMKDAAWSLGKILTMNLPETTESISDVRKQLSPARFLQALCLMIQQEQPCFVHSNAKENGPKMHCFTCHALFKLVPESAFDLMNRLLDPNPHSRITAEEALCHPFIIGLDKVLRDFNELFQTGQDSDATVEVQGEKFRVHKAILSIRCPFFANMLKHDMVEKSTGVVKVPDYTAHEFKDFLLYLYTARVESFTAEKALSLYRAADQYDVQNLKADCLEFLKRNLSVDMIGDVIALPIKFEEKELLQLAEWFFTKNLLAIIESDNWKRFGKENFDKANVHRGSQVNYVENLNWYSVLCSRLKQCPF